MALRGFSEPVRVHSVALRAGAERRERFPGFRLTGWDFRGLIRNQDARARLGDLMVGAGVPS